MAKYCLDVALVLETGPRATSQRHDAIVISRLPALVKALLCAGPIDAAGTADDEEGHKTLLLDAIRRTGKSGDERVDFAAVGAEISPDTSCWVDAPGATAFELRFDARALAREHGQLPPALKYVVVVRRQRASEGGWEEGHMGAADAPPAAATKRIAGASVCA